MGAQVTGIDLSDKAIDAARELAIKAGTHTQFICTDLYSLPDVLDQNSIMYSQVTEPLVGFLI
jgi:2-polyprenyl-3-methyl-5-hydroxy-6-metoxy-1,4-benzoquinol methylase